MTNPVIYAAAYLLLTGAPVVDEGQPAPVPSPIASTARQCACPPNKDCGPDGHILRRIFEAPRDRDYQREDHHHHHHHHHH